MTKAITTNEIYVSEFAAFIRTNCEKKYATDEAIARLVGSPAVKLSVGDKITVQCMNHERDAIFWQREYVVAHRHDYLKRAANEQGNVHHADAFDLSVKPLCEWLSVTPDPTLIEEEKVPTTAEHRGFGSYMILDQNGEDMFAIGKDEGGKARAEAIVSGKESVAA